VPAGGPRPTPYDAALAAVLLFTATSRVISPQYLIWLIGLAAVCLTVRRTTQRPVAALLLLAATLFSCARLWRAAVPRAGARAEGCAP
jgi:hypothetical protein